MLLKNGCRCDRRISSPSRRSICFLTRVTSLDPQKKEVKLENGKTYGFGALLLATGAEPVRIPVPGADESQLCYLRSWTDARRLIERAATAKQVLIVGASFIGLEVAVSLRERGIAVHIAAREGEPLERSGKGDRPIRS